MESSKDDRFTKGRQDRKCPKCGEWELNEMGICNHCGYREINDRFEK